MDFHYSDTKIQLCSMSGHEITYWLMKGKNVFRHRGEIVMVLRDGDSRSVIYGDEEDANSLILKGFLEFVGVRLQLTKSFQERMNRGV